MPSQPHQPGQPLCAAPARPGTCCGTGREDTHLWLACGYFTPCTHLEGTSPGSGPLGSSFAQPSPLTTAQDCKACAHSSAQHPAMQHCLSYKDHFFGSMKVLTVPQRAGLGGCKAICFVRQLTAQTQSVCSFLWFLLKMLPSSFPNLCLRPSFSAQPIYTLQSLRCFNSHQSLRAPP